MTNHTCTSSPSSPIDSDNRRAYRKSYHGQYSNDRDRNGGQTQSRFQGHRLGPQSSESPIQSSTCHSSPTVNTLDPHEELNDLRRQVLALANAKKPSEEGKKRKRM